MRVTAITRPVLCRTRSPGDQHGISISFGSGNRRAQEDAGGSGSPAGQRRGGIHWAQVRNDQGTGAAWAVAHRIAKSIWLIMHTGVEYIEKGAAPLNPRTLARKLRKLVRQVTLQGMDIKSLLEQELAANASAVFSRVRTRQTQVVRARVAHALLYSWRRTAEIFRRR